jgi:hypothetical protein
MTDSEVRIRREDRKSRKDRTVSFSDEISVHPTHSNQVKLLFNLKLN